MGGALQGNRVGLILVVAIVLVSLACLCLAAVAGVIVLRSREGPTVQGVASPGVATTARVPSPTGEERRGVAVTTTASAGVTETPVVMCTPPLCQPGEALECPSECPGGCGSICASPLPQLGLTPGALSDCGADLDLLSLTLTYGPDHPLLQLVLQRCLVVLEATEADATGDGMPEQFAITSGAGCGSCEAQTLFVFVDRELALEYEGSLLEVAVHEDGAGFDLRGAAYSSDDPMCCPSEVQFTPFRWTEGAFEAGEPWTELAG